jgi:hypothetical protein
LFFFYLSGERKNNLVTRFEGADFTKTRSQVWRWRVFFFVSVPKKCFTAEFHYFFHFEKLEADSR